MFVLWHLCENSILSMKQGALMFVLWHLCESSILSMKQGAVMFVLWHLRESSILSMKEQMYWVELVQSMNNLHIYTEFSLHPWLRGCVSECVSLHMCLFVSICLYVYVFEIMSLYIAVCHLTLWSCLWVCVLLCVLYDFWTPCFSYSLWELCA